MVTAVITPTRPALLPVACSWRAPTGREKIAHMPGTLTLRPYTAEDRAWFVTLFGDADVMAHVGGPLPAEAAEGLFEKILAGGGRRLSGRGRILAAWLAMGSEGERIGHAVLLNDEAGVEIGYILPQQHWGQGHGTTIANLLVRVGFEDETLTQLVATVDAEHRPSQRVLEKAGFGSPQRIEDEDGAYLRYQITRSAL